ncbi:MAG: hypothetical protein ACRBK7_17475 [Acidimicrobiales bacterium]
MSSRSLRADIEPGPVEAVLAEPSIPHGSTPDRVAERESTTALAVPDIQPDTGYDAPSTTAAPAASISSVAAAATAEPKDNAEPFNLDDGPKKTTAVPAPEHRFNFVGAQPVPTPLETRTDSDRIATPQAADDLASGAATDSEPVAQSMSDRLEAAAELRTAPLAAERVAPNEAPAADITVGDTAAPEYAVEGRLVEGELGGTTGDPYPADPGSPSPSPTSNNTPSGAAQPTGGAQSPPVVIGSIEIVNPAAPAARPDPLAPMANRRRQGRRQSRSRAMRGTV